MDLSSTIEILDGIKNMFTSDSDKDINKKTQEVLLRNYFAEVYYNKTLLDTINLNSGLDNNRLKSIKAMHPI